MNTRRKRLTFRSAHEDDDSLPQYELHDDFEFVTLHFELVDVIQS